MEKIVIVLSMLIVSVHSGEFNNPWNPLAIADMQPRMSIKEMQQLMTTEDWNTLTSPDLVSRLIRAIPSTNDTCSRDILIAIAALEKKNMAAIELFDSWAKLPSGFLQGNYQWLGSFDQCRNVSFDDETQFKGRYCLAKLAGKGPISALLYGFCFPDSCSEEDAAIVFATALSDVISSLELVDLKCNIPQSFEKADIAFISLSVVLLYLVLMGTIVDLTYRWKAAKRTSELDASIQNETTGLLTGRDTNSREIVDVPRLARFCICFSLLTNGSKLLSTSSSSKSVNCLNGIRVFSINWIVLGHLTTLMIGFVDNPIIVADVIQRFSYQVIINAVVAVDSFFFLSGFLVGYLTFLELESKSGRLNWLYYYFHRIIRIVPLYAFVLFCFVTMTKYLGNGPLMPYFVQSNFTYNCYDYWWTNLLFINNFYPTDFDYSCMQWSWYLANDMQFYILSPLFIYPLFRWRKLGISIAFLTVLASTITYGVINSYWGLSPRFTDSPTRKLPDGTSTMSLVYVRPYTRIPAYIVGILAAYVLFMRRDLRISKAIASVGWTTATALGLLIVYGLYPLYYDLTMVWDQSVYSLYNCTFRLVWSMVLAWIVIACHRRRGGLIDAILSWKVWIPLSRLTYGVYLIHIVVICVIFVNFRVMSHYTDLTLAVLYVATLVLTYAVAFLFALFVEYPLFAVEEFFRKQYTNNRR